MAFKKNDFIEIEFTGKIKDSDIFDSNIKKDIESAGLRVQAKPFVFALGQGMFLQAVDEFLTKKELNKKYELELKPEKAFGIRNSKFVQVMSMKNFKQQDIRPVPGVMFNFDGRAGKILSVSGGRVIVDFNHPLAGKIVQYDLKILRKVEDLNEKIKSFIEFLFKRDIEFSVNKQDKKIIIKVEKQMKQFIEMFAEKFKDVFELDLEVKGVEVKKKDEIEKKNSSQEIAQDN